MIPTPLGVTPLRDTSPRWRRVWVSLLAAVFLAPMAVGCVSGKESQAEGQICDVPASSDEGKVLRQVLDSTELQTDISNENDDIAEKMPERLQKGDFRGFGFPLRVCSFAPKSTVGAHRLSIEFLWVARDESAREDPGLTEPISHYNVNGALGEASDTVSRLRVECRLGGDFKKPSKRVLLQGKAWNTLLMGTKVEQATKDQQVSFLYLMTRRATDILGCQNDPLTKDPVVKPYGSASEAAVAG